MSKPILALRVAPDMLVRNAINRGKKTLTIRRGWRHVEIGQELVLFGTEIPWVVSVMVSYYSHPKVQDITLVECQHAGFEGFTEMVNGMRKHYRDLMLDEPMTLIGWSAVSGYWAEHPNGYPEYHAGLERIPDPPPLEHL